MAADELFDVKNAFYIGNYQQAVHTAINSKCSPAGKEVSKIYMYRGYIAQGQYNVVLNEVKPGKSSTYDVLRLYAQLMSGTNSDKVLSNLEQISLNVEDPHCMTLAGMVFLQCNQPESALKLVQDIENIECQAVAVHALLSMERPDIAMKEVIKMQRTDEDSTLTQLAQAWVCMHLGGDKIQEAYYIYQELCDKFTSTPMLLNAVAGSLMQMGRLDDAETALQEAMEKDSKNPDTLANQYSLFHLQGKAPDVLGRIQTQLSDCAGAENHPFNVFRNSKLSEFASLSATYSASVSS